jgi:hypothetical protein
MACSGNAMNIDIDRTSERLANDPRLSDYDFWRSLKNLENEIFQLSSRKEPVPIEMLRWRRILSGARHRRGLA